MREIQYMLKNGPITGVVVIICTVVYLYSLFLQQHAPKGQVAYRLGALEAKTIKMRHEYWRLVSCNFIHVDFLHYLFNIYFLMDLGTWLETQLGLVLYLFLLVVSGMLASLLTYVYDLKKHQSHITFGASGMAFGLMGFIAGLMLFKGAIYRMILGNFIFVIVINLVYTFRRPDVSKTGHLGGFIGGLLVSLLW